MQALESILHDALEEAGNRALDLQRRGFRRWTKPDGSPVTEADLAADAILEKRLRAALPDAGWQSEESGENVPAQDRFWLVDPVDGTSAFASNGSGWCVAVALIENGSPILSGVFAPVTATMFIAIRGRGAFRNGAAISASGRTGLEGASLIASAASLVRQQFPPVRRASLHSMALRLCAVAEGAQDGMFSIGPKHDWDVAAGDLLVREAGGTASDLAGAPLRYGLAGQRRSGVVASGPHIHPEILAHAARVPTEQKP